MLKTLVLAVSLAAGSAQPPETGTLVAAASDPAVRHIYSVQTAAVTVPAPRLTKAFAKLYGKAHQQAAAGRIPADRTSKLKWVLRTALGDVGRYVRPAKPYRKQPMTAVNSCTGWWVTPQGHMVTAASCLGYDGATLRAFAVAEVMAPIVSRGDGQAFLKAAKISKPDEGLAKLAQGLFQAFNARHLKVSGLRSTMLLEQPTGKARPDLKPLSVLARGEEFPGVDFALLKLKGARNLPTIRLGDDAGVRIGDRLYVNGYPRTLVDSATFSDRSRMRPLLTEGPMNGRRVTAFGVPYLQTQAPSYAGNTGGPVLTADGRAAGMTVAVLSDPLLGEQTETLGMVLPASLIKQRLGAAGVRPVWSETSRVYRAGLGDYFAGRHQAALAKFRRVLALDPGHLYVREYLKAAKAR
ncbi:trypsin-like peptidase domain-containing protein [Nonomuraea sp. NPDC050328]|uniref:trypsin-like peptidase domain-containing protein n=1 Tax=Nonomuraea sp. NPDC050328 TaxID=3364361 RepID=UPI0037921118